MTLESILRRYADANLRYLQDGMAILSFLQFVVVTNNVIRFLVFLLKFHNCGLASWFCRTLCLQGIDFHRLLSSTFQSILELHRSYRGWVLQLEFFRGGEGDETV